MFYTAISVYNLLTLSNLEDAVLLVCLVDKEKGTSIWACVLCHLGPVQLGCAQLSPSATSVSPNLYELANGGHTVVYIGQKKDRKKDLDILPYIPMYGELLKGIRIVSRLTDIGLSELSLLLLLFLGVGSWAAQAFCKSPCRPGPSHTAHPALLLGTRWCEE
jgi:hypothetical protein